ncbi:hypothetical protein FI667_g5332, partial [Globisporangium splendens]
MEAAARAHGDGAAPPTGDANSADAALQALAQQLDAIVTHKFPSSRGGEQRIDLYLELNQLLRVEDTPESVQALRARLPALLLEFHYDLQNATVNDLLHVCLRTLSYFMYHKTLAATFSDAQVAMFLSDIISLLFSTSDEYPQVVLVLDSTVRIWLKPICSRLASSHEPTWEQSRLILKEASRFVTKWSEEVLEELQDWMVQYALPAVKAHMEKERNKSALQLWILILQLMKSTLATDLTILNDILYIPEISMQHEDASVRLMSMEAWYHLVAVFRQSKEWFFKKSVVQLLVRPVIVCIEDEALMNIVQAAFVTWQNIVSALVQDFNQFCADQEHVPRAIQANSRKWKRWYHESVTRPLVAIMESRQADKKQEGSLREVLQYFEFAASVWMFDKTAQLNSSSETTANISDEENVAAQSKSEAKYVVLDMADTQGRQSSPFSILEEQHSSSIGSNLFGLAFMLPDVLNMIRRLLVHAEKLTSQPDCNQVASLAETVWMGLSQRLHLSKVLAGDEDKQQKLRLRLLRICLEFAFGMPSSLALPPDSQISSSQAGADATVSTNVQVGFNSSRCLLLIRWQLQLLGPLISGFQGQDELISLFVHPKSKLSQHLLNQIRLVKEESPTSTQIMAKWDSETLSNQCVDFSSRANTIPCAIVYLSLEYPTLLESNLQDRVKLASLEKASEVVAELLACADADIQESVGLVLELKQLTDTIFQVGKAVLKETFSTGKPCSREEFLSGCLARSSISTDERHVSTEKETSRPETGAPSGTTLASASSIEQLGTPTSADPTSVASAPADTSMPSPRLLESVSQTRIAPEVLIDCEVKAEYSTTRKLITQGVPPTTPKKERKLGDFWTSKTSNPPSPLAIRQPFAQRNPQSERNTNLQCICPDEFSGRKDRLKNIASSPFRQRVQASAEVTPASPAPIQGASPSPRRILKRPALPNNRFLSPIPLESPHQKRARRPLLGLTSEIDAADEEESETTRKLPKIAERVTFCLPTGDGEGETRIARPGEDSQDSNAAAPVKVNEDSEEKMEQFSVKFLQHLRRSAYYMDKIVAEDESLQSDAGLRTNASKMDTLLLDLQQAHDLIARVSGQLQTITEANEKNCQKMLEGRDDGTQ